MNAPGFKEKNQSSLVWICLKNLNVGKTEENTRWIGYVVGESGQ